MNPAAAASAPASAASVSPASAASVAPASAVEAHQRYSQWWDVYFGVVAVAVAAAILLADNHPLWRRFYKT